MNDETKKTLDDFAGDFKNSFDIVIAEGKIGIGHIRRRKCEPIFFDSVWGCIVITPDDSGHEDATLFYHIRGSHPATACNHSWRIRFACKPIAALIVECDGEVVVPDYIRRLNIYARTDIGTMVLSIMPAFEREARTLVAGITEDKTASQLIQQLATCWLHEILGKSMN